LCTLLLGEVGRDRQVWRVFNDLKTKIESDRPLTMYDCHHQLRRLLQLEGWKCAESVFLLIIRSPLKLHLLAVFVLAGCWDKFESMQVPNGHGTRTLDQIVGALEPVSWHLTVRDKVRECRLCEASVTPTMKAAREGDFITFLANVHASRAVLDETDLMGHGVLFWALTARHTSTAILDYLIIASRVRRR